MGTPLSYPIFSHPKIMTGYESAIPVEKQTLKHQFSICEAHVGIQLSKVSLSQVVGPKVIFVPGFASTMLSAR